MEGQDNFSQSKYNEKLKLLNELKDLKSNSNEEIFNYIKTYDKINKQFDNLIDLHYSKALAATNVFFAIAAASSPFIIKKLKPSFLKCLGLGGVGLFFGNMLTSRLQSNEYKTLITEKVKQSFNIDYEFKKEAANKLTYKH